MMRSRKVVLVSLLGLALGCGQSHEAVKPTKTSTEGERLQAQKERAASEREVQAANDPPPPNLTANPGGNPENYYDTTVYSARNEHLAHARALSEHAKGHEAVAANLERFEAAECKQFPPSTRSACPLLGPVTQITDLPNGVRAHFSTGVRADAVLAHMRCHLAFAMARGFGVASSCPLYMKGVVLEAGKEPNSIDILGVDAKVAGQVRKLAREEAVVVPVKVK